MSTPDTPPAAPRWAVRNPERAVVWLIAVGTLFRLVIAATCGLGNGESYYFSCSRHLDLSYFDHPPMHAWLARLATEVGGVHPLVLRVPFVACFALTTWLVFALGRRLFGARAGFYAALLLNLSPVFSLTTGAFLQPDGPLMPAWLLVFGGLAHLFLKPNPRHATLVWAGIGVALGVAMLCKYHAVFLVPAAVLFVLTRREQRHWLTHPGPYLALALAGLMFAPVLVWNARNEWISFLWQGGRGTAYQGLRFDWLARSVGGQALWLLPWIWFPMVWEFAVCLRRGPADSRRWLVACCAAPPILFFTLTALYAPYGLHFHWQAPGYLLLFLPLGDRVAKLLDRLQPRTVLTRRWLRFTAVASLLAFAFVGTQTAYGWLEWVVPGKAGEQLAVHDPTLEGVDYANLEAALAERGLLGRENTFIFTTKWYLSGKVDYALRGRAEVLCLSPDDPRAFAFFDPQGPYLGKDGVLVAHTRFTPPADFERLFADHFERVTPVGTVEVPRGGRTAVTLTLYLCERFRAKVGQPYGKDRGTWPIVSTAGKDSTTPDGK